MEKASFSVDEFCYRNGMSRATFYNRKKAGKGPRIFRDGGRIRISREAEVDWQRCGEAEADAAHAN